MDQGQKAALLEAFGTYLDKLDEQAPEPATENDLFSLFSELAALRIEAKTGSRQVNAALEQCREAFGLLGQAQGQLERGLEQSRQDLSAARRAALKPLLLELLDLHDRLAVGQAALERYRPLKGWFRIKSRKQDVQFINSIQQGQAMTLRRLEETLSRHNVRPLETLGKAADPHTMSVVDLDHRPDLENGVVTAELRKGFLWGGETLRLAEVKANKP